MTRPLKVYAWQSFRPMQKGGRVQTREVCAASSGAEVARIMGVTSPARLFNFGETGNVEECEYALARPRVVCFREINARHGAAFYQAETADKPAAARVGFRTRRRRPPPLAELPEQRTEISLPRVAAIANKALASLGLKARAALQNPAEVDDPTLALEDVLVWIDGGGLVWAGVVVHHPGSREEPPDDEIVEEEEIDRPSEMKAAFELVRRFVMRSVDDFFENYSVEEVLRTDCDLCNGSGVAPRLGKPCSKCEGTGKVEAEEASS